MSADVNTAFTNAGPSLLGRARQGILEAFHTVKSAVTPSRATTVTPSRATTTGAVVGAGLLAGCVPLYVTPDVSQMYYGPAPVVGVTPYGVAPAGPPAVLDPCAYGCYDGGPFAPPFIVGGGINGGGRFEGRRFEGPRFDGGRFNGGAVRGGGVFRGGGAHGPRH